MIRYLEDFEAGQKFGSARLSVEAARIKSFAAEFDPQPFHVSEESAQHTFFKGLAASGWHTAAISMRLVVKSVPIRGGIVGAGGELTWPTLTRPGVTLHVESEILELRPSRSHPDRGMATLRSETVNQHGEVVLVLIAKLVVPRRTS